MQKLKQYPFVIIFAAFMLLLSVTDMFVSRREFSEMENRKLAQKPKISFSSLVAKDEQNKYSYKYETYVNDQFVGRDMWITLKSVSESALLKIENNGIVYGKGGRMFEYFPPSSLDIQRLELNTKLLAEFVGLYGDKVPVTVAVVPNSYEIMADKLPAGLENTDQRAWISKIYSELPDAAHTLDLFPVMENALAYAKRNNPNSFPGTERPVYYRTDHHWTTLGAYHAYAAFCESRGRKAVELADVGTMSNPEPNIFSLRHEVTGFLGSYYSKCKLFSAVPDTIEWYDVPIKSITIDGVEKPTMNDPAQWEKRDKHAAFLWGNNGVTVMKSDCNLNAGEKPSRVLLVKDSYGNSLAPFLCYSYDEVWVVDLRSLRMDTKFSGLMADNDFDDVLVQYNFMNFASDTNFTFLTR